MGFEPRRVVASAVTAMTEVGELSGAGVRHAYTAGDDPQTRLETELSRKNDLEF